jgi:hypothetical protein
LLSTSLKINQCEHQLRAAHALACLTAGGGIRITGTVYVLSRPLCHDHQNWEKLT